MLNAPVSENLPTTDSPKQNLEPSEQGERLTPGRIALFLSPLILGLAADLITKSYMFATYFDPTTLGPQTRHWFIDNLLGIQTSTNPGALFGLGSGFSLQFAALSIVAVVGILAWVFIFGAWTDRWLTFSLGMVTGGILGNLYDRLGWGFTEGFPESIRNNVRDWILFQLEGVPFFEPWPNFNIADSLLVTGAIMLFVHAFLFAPTDESLDQERPQQEASSSNG